LGWSDTESELIYQLYKRQMVSELILSQKGLEDQSVGRGGAEEKGGKKRGEE